MTPHEPPSKFLSGEEVSARLVRAHTHWFWELLSGSLRVTRAKARSSGTLVAALAVTKQRANPNRTK